MKYLENISLYAKCLEDKFGTENHWDKFRYVQIQNSVLPYLPQILLSYCLISSK